MTAPKDVLPEWFYNVGAIALAASSALTALAYLISASKRILAAKAARKAHTELESISKTQGAVVAKGVITHDAVRGIGPPPSAVMARDQFVKRLNQAREALAAEKSSARSTKIVANILIFVQVIIGGVLATSFVQHQNPTVVSLLGIVVLIASLVRQQYHPEVNAQESRRKAAKLLALIRSAENQLLAVDAKSTNGEDRTDSLIALTTQLTDQLTEIENSERIGSTLPVPPISDKPA